MAGRWASPSAGARAAPIFRAVVVRDLQDLIEAQRLRRLRAGSSAHALRLRATSFLA